MVRVFLKGGVWKNSEDEILKAAVQKYGKNQWARVASLLNRKTAKQAKARWHEWLDPSVRKVEWSRDEEERLLHLAKLMPAQWKTIGPLVGRTATQCQERYEKLLDEAAAATAATETAGGEGGEDLRQQPLRIGQIDSHPETKPARPDPIDMDEDEIEMLQEARARLANTQGKKAKRKAREKMLAQAKRLTELQKRRELKQAGLMSSQAKRRARRGKEIDLGVEIPFHKPAPAGFHDVSGEVARSEVLRAKQQRSVDFQKLNEQQYRSRDAEAQKAKKREEARLRALEKSNMQYVVAQVSKTNDALNIRTRGPLELPAPTVSDKELQSLAKMESAAAATNPMAAGGGGSGATAALLADYSDRPLPTPLRTPMTMASSRTESKQQSILREASNLRMLERGQTPLLGGENPLLEGRPGDDADVDSKPPGHNATPGGPLGRGGAQTPLGPARDHFGLNSQGRPQSELRGGLDDSASVGAYTFATATTMSIRDLARAERRAAKRARKELDAALAGLPAPQYEYELEAPMDVDGIEDEGRLVETVREEDMADVQEQKLRRMQEEADKQYEARSSVVKRVDLPRPFGAIPLFAGNATTKTTSPMEAAEALIDEERYTLLKHDAHAFPVVPPSSMIDSAGSSADKKARKKKRKLQDDGEASGAIPPDTPLPPISEHALDAAKELIHLEYDKLLNEKSQPLLAAGKTAEQALALILEETAKATSVAHAEVFLENSWKETKQGDDNMLEESLSLQFDTLQEAASVLRKKNEKIESKVALLTGGLAKRAQSTLSEIVQLYHNVQNAAIEESVYHHLKDQEERGAVARIDRLRSDVARLHSDEVRLQRVYQELLAGRNSAVAN